MNATVLNILNRFLTWAENQPEIRTVLLIGSRARLENPADEYSDVDLIVSVHDPDPFLSSTEWLEDIGSVWVTHVEPTAVGDAVERRVLFDGGVDFDFVIVREDDLPLIVQIPEILGTIRRGMRVLIDKDRVMARITLPLVTPSQYQPPTEAEFLNVVNDFWYHAMWSAKKLLRGELWTAKGSIDGYMKRLLLKMIEWHTRAVSKGTYDTWFNGRFLEEWADGRIVTELRPTFAWYDADDVRRALFFTMDVFRWLARETAAQLTYSYPVWGDEQVTQWVTEMLGEEA